MSKVDAQRAMREAKYARDNASGARRREAAAAAATSTSPAGPAPAAKPARTSSAAPTPTALTAAAPQGERCGHKSMNGRACTRDAAHSEKSHRYG